ncbi:fumarate reductase (CoM/CoB) subunit B [Methanococcus voltae]|uniref:fumarate reductase (CoM/CoB) subunit TfrB n=1 Tax=Methanococcus voltae TaxID=2188 RepID=UPI001FD96115|nr:fumarate reductase (CoM/CoB) subunit TfrB [Methanococcus voltae]MBP2144011.1 fumarate reductase (CoM/CoB) subunit B [Methanococcus voltae]
MKNTDDLLIPIYIMRNKIFKKYMVPSDLTIIEALEYLNNNGYEIKYRSSCKAGQCGSCAVTVDGLPKLACKTKVKEDMKIEPLRNFDLIEDLVVNREEYYKAQKEFENWIHETSEVEEEKIEKIEKNKENNDKKDNLKILSDEDLFKSISDIGSVRNCIDCMSCMSTCPARMYSDYMGPTFMRLLARYARDARDNKDRVKEAFEKNLYNCTTCGRCIKVCPNNIDTVHNAVEKLRELSFKKGLYLENHLDVRKNITENPAKRTVTKPEAPKIGFLEDVINNPKKFNNEFTEKIVIENKDNINKSVEYVAKNSKVTVALFTGCLMDYRLQELGMSGIRVLNAHGISVIIPINQVCCGSPLIRTGQTDVAKELKNINLGIFDKLFADKSLDSIVTLCAGCGSTLKNDYGEKEFVVKDITELLVEKGLLNYKPCKLKVTYHDPCHLKRGQDIFEQPRIILNSIPELEFIEMEIPDQCCGAGGGVRSGKPEVAYKIGEKKTEMILETKADYVITVCPFCNYHIADCLSKVSNIPVMNIVKLLDKVI